MQIVRKMKLDWKYSEDRTWFKLFGRWEDWNVSGRESSVSASGRGGALGGESGRTMQLSRMSSYCWPLILRFSDQATRLNPADPRREEHFKTKSFKSSSSHHIGEVVCQLPAWRKKRFTWRGRFWELVNNRWFTLSSFSWSLPSLVVDKLTSYSVF